MMLSAVLLGAAAGCSSLLSMTDAGRASEAKAGASASKQVEASMGFVDSPELESYVAGVGSRLVAQAPETKLSFQFRVVDQPDPNAFALPGGYVYVSRGLLVLLDTEDELAGVVGHEIGHVVARHHLQTLARSVPLAPLRIATGLGGALASMVSPTVGRLIKGTGEVTSQLVAAPYSRNQEREADRLGQQFAAEAGWDPVALAEVMHKLGQELELAGGDASRVSILATHPASEERRRAAIANASELTRAAGQPAPLPHEAFLRKFEGMVVGAGAAGGVFAGDDFLHPGMEFAITLPHGWKQVNTDAYAGALDEKGGAAVLLQLEGEGNDPLAAAKNASLGGARLDGEPRATKVGSRSAAFATSTGSKGRVRFTWIAHRGQIFRITTGAPASSYAARENALFAAISSFRDLSAADRARVLEDRLKVVEARRGETLGQLLERNRSRWEPAHAAVANGVASDDRLTANQPIKITTPVRYGF